MGPCVLTARGYTKRDLDEMTAAACRADRSPGSDAHPHYETARSAIAQELVRANRRIGSGTKERPVHCLNGNGPHEMTPENTYR